MLRGSRRLGEAAYKGNSEIRSGKSEGHDFKLLTSTCYLFIFKNKFIIYVWLRRVFIVVRGLSLIAEHRLGSFGTWAQQLWHAGSRRGGFSTCGSQAQ